MVLACIVGLNGALAVGQEQKIPAIALPSCIIQSTNGSPVNWQVKATATVDNLPKDATVSVTITFKKQASGAKEFVAIGNPITQTASSSNGSATIDTGFQELPQAPAAGDRYQVVFGKATYTVTGKEPVAMPDASSEPITPVRGRRPQKKSMMQSGGSAHYQPFAGHRPH